MSTVFVNPDYPEDVSQCTPVQPSHPGLNFLQDHICVPGSPRTRAEECKVFEPYLVAGARMFIIDTFRSDGLVRLFRTHPSTGASITRLEAILRAGFARAVWRRAGEMDSGFACDTLSRNARDVGYTGDS